ncbi:DcuS/MalK family sensor histidine kinase [Planococcus halotolerans]|uniref:histidine kinase n=1 Tax=Planococcus halotolerans TaxID=2233542 RepID=A0A365KXA0_9BACL|nr:DcuS/MalK family sensor histidine kinase [Planococcus halotolerans]RAZ77808.1 two-component system sensor histidine kinase DcuS [Planococcus halotolerans]
MTLSSRFKLSTIIILFVCSVVLVSLLITNLLIADTSGEVIEQQLEEKAVSISRTAAESQVVRDGLQSEAAEENIQDYALAVQQATEVLFVVVIDMDGIRKSHPNPDNIGKAFAGGDELRVLQGEAYTSRAEGTLGLSVRSFTPVFDTAENQIGAVAVGISLQEVDTAIQQNRKTILLGSLIGLLIGIIGAFWLARYIKKNLLGLEPHEIARIHEERNQMLHSVYEGVIAIDKNCRILLVNKSASELLKKAGLMDNDLVSQDIREFLPNLELERVLQDKKTILDEEQTVNGLTIISNQVPLLVNEEVIGAIVTFRDKTELNQLAEQLTGVEMYAETLRAQSHEFMNQLHVLLGLIKLEEYDQVSNFIGKLVDHQVYEVGNITRYIKDPVLAGFIIGKISFAREAHVELTISCETEIPKPADPAVTHELVTIIGNVIDNAIENVIGMEQRSIHTAFSYIDELLTITISDTGTGIPEELQESIFTKGVSNKEGYHRGFGLHLVKNSVEKLEGSIDVDSDIKKGTTFEVVLPYEAGGDNDD